MTMAQRTILSLIDDLDGTEADSDNIVSTVTFALDGVEYEIDLSEENAERLRNSMTEYVEAARRTGGRRRAPLTSVDGQRKAATGNPEAKAIRDWARANGHEDLGDRGRIPAMIIEEYREAQAVKAESEAKPARKRRKPATVKVVA
jgi:hypothetical protein